MMISKTSRWLCVVTTPSQSQKVCESFIRLYSFTIMIARFVSLVFIEKLFDNTLGIVVVFVVSNTRV